MLKVKVKVKKKILNCSVLNNESLHLSEVLNAGH